MRAARALVGMEQKALADASGVSLPTIQRMEASNGVVRGVIETLMKVMSALEAAGVEFINEGATSTGGGRGVRLRNRTGGGPFIRPMAHRRRNLFSSSVLYRRRNGPGAGRTCRGGRLPAAVVRRARRCRGTL